MLEELEYDTVQLRPNYDETLTEPKVLPSRFPNIFVNGASGIAVGMATNIPPHNLGEIIDATLLLVDEPDSTQNNYIKLSKVQIFQLVELFQELQVLILCMKLEGERNRSFKLHEEKTKPEMRLSLLKFHTFKINLSF